MNDNHTVDEQLVGESATSAGTELFDTSTTATCAFSATQAKFESEGFYVATAGADHLTGQTVTLMLDGVDGPAGGSLVTIQNLTGSLITASFGMAETAQVVFIQSFTIQS